MRIEDGIYFSPTLKYRDVELDNPEMLIQAFRDRINGFYLGPIKKLNEDNDAFAAGLLCVTTMDVLSRLKSNSEEVRKRYVHWLATEIPEFAQRLPGKKHILADLFYKHFRNGLVHEGRIKDGGQFSYIFGGMITVENQFMIVNPLQLADNIESVFNRYMAEVLTSPEEFQSFSKMIIRDFGAEIERAKSD